MSEANRVDVIIVPTQWLASGRPLRLVLFPEFPKCEAGDEEPGTATWVEMARELDKLKRYIEELERKLLAFADARFHEGCLRRPAGNSSPSPFIFRPATPTPMTLKE